MEQSDYKFWNHLSFQQMPSSYFPWTSVKVPIQTKIWSKCVNCEIEEEVPELIPVIDGSNQEWPGWEWRHCWHFHGENLIKSAFFPADTSSPPAYQVQAWFLQLLKAPPTFWNIHSVLSFLWFHGLASWPINCSSDGTLIISLSCFSFHVCMLSFICSFIQWALTKSLLQAGTILDS